VAFSQNGLNRPPRLPKLLKKTRLDYLIVGRGLASDLKEAQALLLSGQIQITPRPTSLKAGSLIPVESVLTLLPGQKYVSRGGDKLEAALDFWGVSVNNHSCLDIGASTGGFTDCFLQRGAQEVYAVDVGYGQFHPKLRSDVRVKLFEKTHILNWRPPWGSRPPDIVAMDLSFMSLIKTMEKLREILKRNAVILALVKPQFEAAPKDLRKGIIKDKEARDRAIGGVRKAFLQDGFKVKGQFPCPVIGAKGNQEEWMLIAMG
jgi:23S rRNA (cytidine1920-2'-O)/16S rRNA (cytidine1409-2'-O)-methyltransferase